MTDNYPQSLKLAIDGLQLPRSPHSQVGYAWIDPVLADFKRTVDDGGIQIDNDVDEWQHGKQPSKFLKAVITAALEAYTEDYYSITGPTYLDLFKRITKGGNKWRGPDWWVTKLLLSKARIIGYLQRAEGYSASQIVRTLAATDHSLQVPFQAVQIIAASYEAEAVPPKEDEIDKTWQIDSDYGGLLFADASLHDSLEIADTMADKFVPHSHVEEQLELLVGAADEAGSSEVNWPYFQMLYWLSLIVEYYDHPAGSLYEFVPRGTSANHVFEKFELSTNNPFLNNAKATAFLSREWALNRGGDDAHALVALVELLESIPHAAGVEVARVLRAWVVRTLSMLKEERRYVKITNPQQAFHSIVEEICERETNTYGVIEQRVVDALSSLAFVTDPTWRPNGLGDHVNATNTSRKKLGDVEFTQFVSGSQDTPTKIRSIALEAHGGHLTKAYVENHQKSLEASLNHRVEDEWSKITDPEFCALEVIYVAHSRTNDVPTEPLTMAGINVETRYMDYHELADLAWSTSSLDLQLEIFDRWVVDVFNSPRVRQSVRDKAVEIMGDSATLVAELKHG